ncbi:MAG: hypothetical protein ACRC8J_02735, partial [Phocaeicola sp.]
MKKAFTLLTFTALLLACQGNKNEGNNPTPSTNVTVMTENLKFNEGSVIYNSTLLFSNFGSDELNPLGTDGKGYITKLVDGKMETFIAADGNLDAPKGMAIKDEKLYIATVGKVVVYDLTKQEAAPIIINMPEGNLFVNDIVIYGDNAFISVTNTGKIFKLNLTDHSLNEYVDIVGANGLIVDGKAMYIASYPADGVTTSSNVIYKIEDVDAPVVSKFIEREGQYDGLALNKSKLYFTSWVNGEVGYVDIATKEVTLLDLSEQKIV